MAYSVAAEATAVAATIATAAMDGLPSRRRAFSVPHPPPPAITFEVSVATRLKFSLFC